MASKKRPTISRAKPRKDTRSAKDILRTGSEGEPDDITGDPRDDNRYTLGEQVLDREAAKDIRLMPDRIEYLATLLPSMERTLNAMADRLIEVEKEVRALRGYEQRAVTPLGSVEQTTKPAKPVEVHGQGVLPGLSPSADDVKAAAFDLIKQGRREVVVKALEFIGVAKVSEIPPEKLAEAHALLTVKAEA